MPVTLSSDVQPEFVFGPSDVISPAKHTNGPPIFLRALLLAPRGTKDLNDDVIHVGRDPAVRWIN